MVGRAIRRGRNIWQRAGDIDAHFLQMMEAGNGSLKLNVGCGTDYREGFVNIDGSTTLPRIDKVIDLDSERLTDHFEPGTVDHILANDIIEHRFHWEAVELLKQFYEVLRPGGTIHLRVPDSEHIIRSMAYDTEQKLVLLFGGQEVPQGGMPRWTSLASSTRSSSVTSTGGRWPG